MAILVLSHNTIVYIIFGFGQRSLTKLTFLLISKKIIEKKEDIQKKTQCHYISDNPFGVWTFRLLPSQTHIWCSGHCEWNFFLSRESAEIVCIQQEVQHCCLGEKGPLTCSFDRDRGRPSKREFHHLTLPQPMNQSCNKKLYIIYMS